MLSNKKEKLDFIKQIADILDEYKLSEIGYKYCSEKNEKVSINIKKQINEDIKNKLNTTNKIDFQNNDKTISINENKKDTKEGHIVKSPMVGTIYLAPDPESEPFIREGEKIKKGDTILIIEAMKTMNQIQATKSGIVEKIFVKNASPVDFGAQLIEIK